MSKSILKNLLLLTSLMLTAGYVSASTGTEFKPSADKFSGWIMGEYGRMIALGSTGVGGLISLGTKQFMPILIGAGVGIALPLVAGLINGSFTAVI